METKRKGTFIVFDGGEGAGKSTVIRRLKQEHGDAIAISREPGGCPRAEEIRKFLLSPEGAALSPDEQFAWFWRARRYHMEDVIIPMLDQGKLFLCDRFDTSTWSYQVRAPGRDDLIPEFWNQRALALGEYAPDLYLIFKVRPWMGLDRTERRGIANHFEARKLEYHQAVLDAMLAFIGVPGINGQVIDAERSADEVYLQVRDVLRAYAPDIM